jgi:hypothetical protein
MSLSETQDLGQSQPPAKVASNLEKTMRIVGNFNGSIRAFTELVRFEPC